MGWLGQSESCGCQSWPVLNSEPPRLACGTRSPLLSEDLQSLGFRLTECEGQERGICLLLIKALPWGPLSFLTLAIRFLKTGTGAYCVHGVIQRARTRWGPASSEIATLGKEEAGGAHSTWSSSGGDPRGPRMHQDLAGSCSGVGNLRG